MTNTLETKPANKVADETAGLTLGPIALAPGVTHLHAMIAVFASLTTMALLVYINIVQPYLLTQILNVPSTELGSVTGRLNALHEIVAIVCMSVIGALSDQWGRRIIYCAGLLHDEDGMSPERRLDQVRLAHLERGFAVNAFGAKAPAAGFSRS